MATADQPNPELDRRIMAAALRIGRRNLGNTFPNPSVGAILVHPDIGGARVVGLGWTGGGGRPHAETVAIAEAGSEAEGATAYVTLEPCSHEGQTPPCADALIAAGVARVVIPITDPDPRVAGKGVSRLKAAGIDVTTGVLQAEAEIAHGGHIYRVTKNRPWITLKLAVSADGMIGRRDGDRMMVSGKPAFERVQAIRADHDAIMVGIGTVEVDNPRLTLRGPAAGGRDLIRVVLDTEARIAPSSTLVETAREVPLWLMVGEAADAARIDALEAEGVRVFKVGTGSGGLDLPAVLARLAEEGITRVLAEGGAKVAGSLLARDLIDEVVLFRAPVVVGRGGVQALSGHALSAIERSPRYRIVGDSMIGEDRMRQFIKVR